MQKILEAHPETSGFDRDRHTARHGYNAKNELIERNQSPHFVESGVAWLQSVDYTYNDQGWLTAINQATLGGTNIAFPTCTTSVVNPGVTTTGQADDTKDLFYMALQYNTLQAGLSGAARNDGDISQVVWRVRGSERQAYSFGYDGLQRITSGTYADINDAGTFTATISNSQRNGLFLSGACYTQALLDNMAYSYTAGTNKISSITDAASATQGGFPAASGSYTYDANGNQISDGAKGFTAITYNHLNLPTKFTQGANTIEIQYDAAGRKLKKIPSGGATKSYIGAFEYSTSTVEAVYHSEGRARNSAGTYIYEYLIKDHLGNTRVAFTNSSGTIALVQENHYYTFGMSQAGWLAEPSPTNAYKYNGKELNTEFGLNLMDYRARWYDSGVGRWTSVDPMAHELPSYSPYNYGFNNPIRLIDPDGRAPYDVIIKGKEAQAAFAELQASVKGQLTLSMDANGKVSSTQDGIGKLSKDALQLLNAINDNSIVVNVNAENTTTTQSGNLYIGGAFSGNTVTKGANGNTVVAEQEVNPGVLSKVSTAHGKPGADMLHEVTEAYQGGLIS